MADYRFQIQGDNLLVIDPVTNQVIQTIENITEQNTVILPSGDIVAVADIISEIENPDVDTAAGQEDNSSVDNNGGVFTPFDPTIGIGGLNAVGGLHATELNYNLIERSNKEFVENDEIGYLNNQPEVILYPPIVDIWNDNNDNGTFEECHDNRDKTICITKEYDENDPTGKPFIGELLSEGHAVDPAKVSGNVPESVTLTYTSNITFTFLSEGAGYLNVVGWYDVNNPTIGHIVWDNASASGSGGDLHNGTSTIVEQIDAGTKLGFFLIPNAAGALSDNIGEVYFKDGHAYTDASFQNMINSDNNGFPTNNPVWFSHEDLNHYNHNNDGLQHAIQGISEDPTDHHLYVGFEDLGGGGDKDYNDVIFKVDLGAVNIIHVGSAEFDVGVTINDIDSTFLNSAVMTFDLGTKDDVTWDPIAALLAGLNVDTTNLVPGVGGTITITGHASIDDYNTLLDSFKIHVGNSGSTENYHNIDTCDRVVSVKVQDDTGLWSNTDSQNYGLNIIDKTHQQESRLSHLDILSFEHDLPLTLDFNSVKEMADHDKLVVQGHAGDTLIISDLNDWTYNGKANENDTDYNVYTHGSTTLYVDYDMLVTQS